jgi:hypothetical protein
MLQAIARLRPLRVPCDDPAVHIHGHLGWIFIEQQSLPRPRPNFASRFASVPNNPAGVLD